MAITNSKKEQLGMPEVIAHALANEARAHRLPEGVDFQTAILAVTKELTMESAEHKQIGNTVFISHYSDDHKEVYMRALNVDTARNYLENAIAYTKYLASAGVERMVSDFKGEAVLHIFNTIAEDYKDAGWGMKVIHNAKDGYRAYVVMKGA